MSDPKASKQDARKFNQAHGASLNALEAARENPIAEVLDIEAHAGAPFPISGDHLAVGKDMWGVK